MRFGTWFKLAVIIAAVIAVIEVAKGISANDGCGAASAAVAHADTGGCPSTVQELAEDSAWARQRIQDLAGQPETTGKLYYPGLIGGFQIKTFTSGYQDSGQADQAIVDTGIVPAGRKLNVAAHAEVKAAAFMRAEGITYAVLVINMPRGVCGVNEKTDQPFTCNTVIPGILPNGSILVVWSPQEVRAQRSLKFEGAATR